MSHSPKLSFDFAEGFVTLRCLQNRGLHVRWIVLMNMQVLHSCPFDFSLSLILRFCHLDYPLSLTLCFSLKNRQLLHNPCGQLRFSRKVGMKVLGLNMIFSPLKMRFNIKSNLFFFHACFMFFQCSYTPFHCRGSRLNSYNSFGPSVCLYMFLLWSLFIHHYVLYFYIKFVYISISRSN